jgi:hypothetical protein
MVLLLLLLHSLITMEKRGAPSRPLLLLLLRRLRLLLQWRPLHDGGC